MGREEMTERKVTIDGVEIPFEKLESLGWTPPQPPEEEPERDPYLVPGAICEVWNDGGDPSLRYFSEYTHKGYPHFIFRRGLVGDSEFFYQHYRVIGTPWDHAPEKAEWVATDQDGRIYFYKTKPEAVSGMWEVCIPICPAGYDAAVESGKVDWTTTLRRRPAWAVREK